VNPDRFFVLSLDVAQILAPVSSGLLAAGAPASDGPNGDGGDFAALLSALAGVLGANPLAPAAGDPAATARGTAKGASAQAGAESPSPFIAVADAGGLQVPGALSEPDTRDLQLQDPETEGERAALAEPEQADPNLVTTSPGDARLVLAMAQGLSPAPTHPSPSLRQGEPQDGTPSAGSGEAPAAAPGMAPAGSSPVATGIAPGALPDRGQAQTAGKPQVKSPDVQATLLASLLDPDIPPGAEVPGTAGPDTAGQRPAETPDTQSVTVARSEPPSSFPVPPPGVVRIVGRQMPAEPAPPTQGAGPAAAVAAILSADIVAPEEAIPTPPMTAKAVAAAGSEGSLAAQAAAVSQLAALVEPPPSRRQDAGSSRSPEARRALSSTPPEPGAEGPETVVPVPPGTPSASPRMAPSAQGLAATDGSDQAKESDVGSKAMAAGAPGRGGVVGISVGGAGGSGRGEAAGALNPSCGCMGGA
jgi:hypothetical protein